jgi:hypothetical protein
MTIMLLSIIVQDTWCSYAECCLSRVLCLFYYDKCSYAQCHRAECHYAECHCAVDQAENACTGQTRCPVQAFSALSTVQ